jgi:hypothetical protein
MIYGNGGSNVPNIHAIMQSGNLYVYAINNPIMYYDPDGLFIRKIGEIIQKGTQTAVRGVANVFDFGIRTVTFGNFNSTQVGASLLMMNYNATTGTYHSRQDNWQQFFGFNNLYDFAFGMGTSADHNFFQFTHDGKDYRFWAWKGDYLNLGAGAEMGIYYNSRIPGHWGVDKSLSLPMSMTLSLNGTQIGSYSPSDPHWWITTFNPAHQRVNAANITATYTIDFSGNVGMFDSFYNKFGIGDDRDTRWSFNTKNYMATLTF